MNTTNHSSTTRQLVRSLKTRADAQRTFSEKIADWMTGKLGSMGFLLLNATWFLVWILINTGKLPFIAPFDPFPFGLLTMIVSLEAIILAIFVLIAQNRAEKVDDLREEVDLQVDMIAEREITKILKLVTQLAEKQGIDLSRDEELRGMLEPTNTERIEATLEKQIL